MNSLKSWGFQYGKFLRGKPSSWVLAVMLAMLPFPSDDPRRYFFGTLGSDGDLGTFFSGDARLRDTSPGAGRLKPRSLKVRPIRELVSNSRLDVTGSLFPGKKAPSSPLLEFSFLGDSSDYPVNDGTGAPQVTARGVYVVDVDSMASLLAKRPDEKLRPASTTKIMTALAAIAAFSGDEVVTAGKADGAVGKTIHLKTGEQVTFSDMLYGLLLESGNDAAFALAENYPGGYEGMIAAMNRKAGELGMNSTEYRNVSGVDQYRHETTVRDMAILTKAAIENELLRQIVATKSKEIVSLDGTVIHQLENTNELLGEVDGVVGVKTGTTDLAGECLITLVERDGRKVILVVFGSNDRFGETRLLIDWVFEHHAWEKIL